MAMMAQPAATHHNVYSNPNAPVPQQAQDTRLYQYGGEYLDRTWTLSVTLPDGCDNQIGSFNTISGFWQYQKTVTLNHFALGARLQIRVQGYMTGWGNGGRFEIRTHDYEAVWQAVCQACVTGQLDPKGVHAVDTAIVADGAVVNVWVSDMQQNDLTAVRDHINQLASAWCEYFPNTPAAQPLPQPQPVPAPLVQASAPVSMGPPSPPHGMQGDVGLYRQMSTMSSVSAMSGLSSSPTDIPQVLLSPSDCSRPPLPPGHITAPQQPVQPTQPVSAGRARGHKKSRSAPQTVSQAFLDQHLRAETGRNEDLSDTSSQSTSKSQNRDQIAPGFVCRGVLYPPGLTRKQRRSIQFQGLKGHEEIEVVRGWEVGLAEADGPVSPEMFERLKQHADELTAKKAAEERARQRLAEEEDDEDDYVGRTRSACYLSDDEEIEDMASSRPCDGEDSVEDVPIVAAVRTNSASRLSGGLRRVNSSPMLLSPFVISTLPSTSQASTPRDNRGEATPPAQSWCEEDSDDDDYVC